MLNKTIPINILKTKTSVFLSKLTIDVNAGPGQKPAKPQPAPKSKEPIINAGVISVLLGTSQLVENKGLILFRIIL